MSMARPANPARTTKARARPMRTWPDCWLIFVATSNSRNRCGTICRTNGCTAEPGKTRNGEDARCQKNLVSKAQNLSAQLYVQIGRFSTIFWGKPRELWLHAYYEKRSNVRKTKRQTTGKQKPRLRSG